MKTKLTLILNLKILKTLAAMLILASIFCQDVQAQQESYTYYGYAYALLDIEGDERIAVVTNVVRFNSIHNNISSIGVELWNVFTSFFGTYYEKYLDVDLVHEGSNLAYKTETEAIESRRKALDLYRDRNVLLIHNFTMNDRGDYIRRYTWSEGHAPKRGNQGTTSSSGKKEEDKKVTVFISKNRFTGQEIVCSSLQEKNNWDVKFAEDNAAADKIEKRTKDYITSSNNLIRQGADRNSTLSASEVAVMATQSTYGDTHQTMKMGEQIGSDLAGLILSVKADNRSYWEAEERERKEALALNKANREEAAKKEWAQTDTSDVFAVQAFMNKYSSLVNEYSDLQYLKLEFKEIMNERNSEGPILAIWDARKRYDTMLEIPSNKKAIVGWLLFRKYGMALVNGGTLKVDKKNSITITSDFYISNYEVTDELYKAVTGSCGYCKKSKKPGVNPDHIAAQRDVESILKFIEKLNEITGMRFRLPTEAEWEFAARGGTQSKGYKYSGSNNWEEVAWFAKNSTLQTYISAIGDHYSFQDSDEVGKLHPNELGLYDMSGNTWELCRGNPYVVRGGSYKSEKSDEMLINKARQVFPERSDTGFRLVLDVENPKP